MTSTVKSGGGRLEDLKIHPPIILVDIWDDILEGPQKPSGTTRSLAPGKARQRPPQSTKRVLNDNLQAEPAISSDSLARSPDSASENRASVVVGGLDKGHNEAAEGATRAVDPNAHLIGLKPAQQAFVRAIADPNSPAYNNGTRAAMVANPTLTTDPSRAATASRLLTNGKIQTAVAIELEKYQLGASERAKLLGSAAHGTAIQVVTTKDSTGKVIATQERPIDPLKAIDIANRMDGTYSRADAAVDVEKDNLKTFFRQHAKSLLGE